MKPTNIENLTLILNKNWNDLEQYCCAIYKGGSRVDPIINNPHDYDYICFAKDLQRHHLLRKLYKLDLKIVGSKNNKKIMHVKSNQQLDTDFSQIRVYPYTQITWFSYLDILMEKAIGEDVCPKTDVINEHRAEFLNELKKKMNLLINGTIRNQKRWYHLLRGAYILQNNSYEVTSEQKREINILHDLSEGWEAVRDKTIDILKQLK